MSPTPRLTNGSRAKRLAFDVESSENVQALIDRIAGEVKDGVDLLGFGEPMHGSEKFLLLRNALFQRLVEVHGFTAIAIESSFPRARVVNEFIAGRGAQSFEEIQDTGFSHNFGRSPANRQLVEWMRQHNASIAQEVKLRFYGFDSPTEMMGSDSPRQLIRFVLNYLDDVEDGRPCDSRLARRERIETLLGADAAWENPAAMFEPEKSVGLSAEATALRIEMEELITELRVRRPECMAKSGRLLYQEAAHYAEVARQFLTYHASVARPASTRIADLLGIRDAMMADNLVYDVRQERDRQPVAGKVFAFAHNCHLMRGQAFWQLGPNELRWWTAGAQVHELLGAKYAVVGTGVASDESGGIAPAESGSLEARLMINQPSSAVVIPTYQGKNLPAPEIAALSTRSSSTKNSTYFPLNSQSITAYDWLMILR